MTHEEDLRLRAPSQNIEEPEILFQDPRLTVQGKGAQGKGKKQGPPGKPPGLQPSGTRGIAAEPPVDLPPQMWQGPPAPPPPRPLTSDQMALDPTIPDWEFLAKVDEEKRNAQVLLNLQRSVGVDPDVAGQIDRLGIDLDLRPDLISPESYEKLRQYQSDREMSAWVTSGGNQMTMRALLNPRFADIAHDDLKNLGFTEMYWKQREAALKQEELSLLHNKQLQSNVRWFGFSPDWVTGGTFTEEDKAKIVALERDLAGLPKNTGYGNFFQNLAYGFSHTEAQMEQTFLTSAAVGLTAGTVAAGTVAGTTWWSGPVSLVGSGSAFLKVGGAAFTATMGTMTAAREAGNAYGEMLRMGIDPNVAAVYAQGIGTVNGLLEATLVGKVSSMALGGLKKRMSRNFVKEMLKGVSRPKAWRQFAVNYGKVQLGEQLEEQAQTISSTIGKALAQLSTAQALSSALGRSKLEEWVPDVGTEEWWEGVGHEMAETMVETARGMAFLGSFGPSIRLTTDLWDVRKAERDGQIISRLGEVVEESKVRERSPQMHLDFLEQLAESHEGELDTLYIDATKFREAMDQIKVDGKPSPMTMEMLEEESPEIAELLKEAEKDGTGSVEIPLPIASHFLVTEFGKRLGLHTSLEPGGLTASFKLDPDRIDQYQEETNRQINLDEDEAQQMRDIEEEFTAQAVETRGATKVEAQMNARLYSHFIATMAREQGISIAEAHKIRGTRAVLGEEAALPSAEVEALDAPAPTTRAQSFIDEVMSLRGDEKTTFPHFQDAYGANWLKVGPGAEDLIQFSMAQTHDWKTDVPQETIDRAASKRPDDVSLSAIKVVGDKRRGVGGKALELFKKLADKHNVRIVGDPDNTLVGQGRVPQKKLEKFYRDRGYKPYHEYKREGETAEELAKRVGPKPVSGWVYIPEGYKPEQPGILEQSALSVVTLTKEQKVTLKDLKKKVLGLSAIMRWLQPDEIVNLVSGRTDTAERRANNLVDTLKVLPSTAELAAVARAGRAKRGWYKRSADALRTIFGDDAPRFSMLLAALSPQTSVEQNLTNTLSVWAGWIEAGRPTDPKIILKIAGERVQGDKGEKSVMEAWRNNTIAALTDENALDTILSGPKVNSFALNLLGEFNEITNDTWVANYAGVDQTLFSGATGVQLPGKNYGYLAMAILTRRAASSLKWTGAEVQETMWSFTKALYERSHGAPTMRKPAAGVSSLEFLTSDGLLHEDVNDTPDFAVLLHNPQYGSILKAAGYGVQLSQLTPSPAPQATGPIYDAKSDDAIHLRRVAKRLDKLAKKRKFDSTRHEVMVNLSASTGSIPGLKKLTDEANQGDKVAAIVLQEIAADHLRHVTTGIKSVKIELTPAMGLFEGEAEPAQALTMSFQERDRAKVLVALRHFAESFNQKQFHVRGKASGHLGKDYGDGSFNTLQYRFNLDRPLSREQAQKVIDDSGLTGLTFTDNYVDIYYSGDPTNAQEVQEFEDAAERAAKSLGASRRTTRRTTGRLWAYGDGARIGYGEIAGKFRAPKGDEAIRTSSRIATRIAGREVEGVAQAEKLTKEQADKQRRIAEAYEAMALDNLSDPNVRRAYEELAKELVIQFGALPIKVEVWTKKGEPYKNSAKMREDVRDNNHLFIYATKKDQFGPPGVTYDNHPLLAESEFVDINDKPLLVNDLLRAVHDYYAHTMKSNQFGPLGEEAAWATHIGMMNNAWARWALTSETRGQNSWVNFREGVEGVPLKKRGFGEQKVDLLPLEFVMTGNPMEDSILGELPGSENLNLEPVPEAMGGPPPSHGQPALDQPATAPLQFFSALARAINRLDTKAATAAGWKQAITGLLKKGVKKDEIFWTGIEDWLDLQEGKITKEQVAEYLREDGVKVEVQERRAEHTPEEQEVSRQRSEAIRDYRDAKDSLRDFIIDEVTEDSVITELWEGDMASMPGAANRFVDFVEDAELEGHTVARRALEEIERDESLLEHLAEQVVEDYVREHRWADRGQAAPPATELHLHKQFMWHVKHVLLTRLEHDEVALAAPEISQPLTKFGDYTLDTGEKVSRRNYREILITLPVGEAKWKKLAFAGAGRAVIEPHFEEPNVVVHIRVIDFIDADGNKGILVEEIQSWWGQEGRKRGFAGGFPDNVLAAAIAGGMTEEQARADIKHLMEDPLDTDPRPTSDQWRRLSDAAGDTIDLNEVFHDRRVEGVPRAPFVESTKGWLNLALKQVMMMAVEGNYDQVAFVTGEQSAARYDLSTKVESIDVTQYGIGTPDEFREVGLNLIDGGNLGLHVTPDGIVSHAEDKLMKGKPLDEVVGKEVAEKIMAAEGEATLKSEDLTVGGEGMKAFYDRIVPQAVKKLVKKVGGKVETVDYGEPTKITELPEGYTVEKRPSIAFGDQFYVLSDRQRNLPGDRHQGHDTESEAVASFLRVHNEALDPAQQIGVQPTLKITDELRESVQAEGGAPLFAPKQRGQYFPSLRTIVLNKNADSSTLSHELSHHFFAMLERVVLEGKASEGQQKDFDTLLKWYGIKGDDAGARADAWAAMSFDETKQFHEQFAYNFEVYLFSGEAPTTSLRKVFHKIRLWMIDVYKDIRNELNAAYRSAFGRDLPVLTPEVRLVFDRMLAAKEMVEAAEAQRAMLPHFQTKEEFLEAGWADEQWLEYQEVLQEAHAASVTSLSVATKKQLQWLTNARGRVLKELQKRHDAERKKVEKVIRAEVEAEHVYQVLAKLKEAEGEAKLNLNGVRELLKDLPEETRKVMEKKLGVGRHGRLSTKGLDPARAAEFLGFDSGKELVRALIAARPVEEEIESRTSERMMRDHGELVDKGTLEMMVQEALHNEARARFVAEEVRFFDRSTEPRSVVLATARAAARRILGNKKIKDIRPDRFAQAEAAAARDAHRLMRPIKPRKAHTRKAYTDKHGVFHEAVSLEAVEGRDQAPEEAANAKRRQLLNNVLTMLSFKVREEIGKALTGFKRLNRSQAKLAKMGDVGLLHAARYLLAQYGLLTQSAEEASVNYIQLLREYDPRLADSLEEMFYKATLAGRELETTRSGRPRWRDMTLDEFRVLREKVDQLVYRAGQNRDIEIEGERVAIEEAAAELIGALPVDDRDSIPGQTGDVSAWHKWKTDLLATKARLNKVELFLRWLDGGKQGPYLRYLFNEVRGGITNYRVDAVVHTKRLVDKLKKLHSDELLPAIEIDAREDDIEFTFGQGSANGMVQLLGALLHTHGNLSNKEKFLVAGRGEGYSWADLTPDGEEFDFSRWDKFIQRLVDEGILTSRHFEFLQDVWNTNEEVKPTIQKAHRRLEGIYFNEVKPQPFTIHFPDGTSVTYPGGYVPATPDHRLIARLAEGEIPATEITVEQVSDNFYNAIPEVPSGFAKDRVPGYRERPLSMDIDMVISHIDQVLRYAHVQPAVSDVQRLMRHKPFQRALRRFDEHAEKHILKPFLERAVTQSLYVQGFFPAIDSFMKLMRRNTGVAIMFGHAANAAQQSTGISNILAWVKGVHVKHATAQLMSTNRGEIIKMINEMSPFMDDRIKNQMFGLTEDVRQLMLNPSGKAQTQAWIGRHAYIFQSIVQTEVDYITWKAAFDQEMASQRLGSIEEMERMAVIEADSIVRAAQGSFAPEDVAAYEKATPTIRTMLQFTNFFNTAMNAMQYAKEGSKIRTWLFVYAIPMIVGDAIVKSFYGEWDDEDDDGHVDGAVWGEVLIGSQLRGAAAMVPVIGPGVLNYYDKSFGDRPFGDRVAASATLTTMARAVVGVAQGIIRAVDEEKEVTPANVRDTITAIIMFIPAGGVLAPLSRPITYGTAIGMGKGVPSGAGIIPYTQTPEWVDLLRGGISGRVSDAERRKAGYR